MINKKFLEQALRIRKDFIKVDDSLLDLRGDLESIQHNLQIAKDNLIDINANPDRYGSETEFNKAVMDELSVFENESLKAKKLYEKYNMNMEALKEEEENLYESLKKEYPNLSDDILVQSINSYIKEKMAV